MGRKAKEAVTSKIRDVTKAGFKAETVLGTEHVDLLGNAINEDSQTAALSIEDVFARLSKITDHEDDLGGYMDTRSIKATDETRLRPADEKTVKDGSTDSTLSTKSLTSDTKVELDAATDTTSTKAVEVASATDDTTSASVATSAKSASASAAAATSSSAAAASGGFPNASNTGVPAGTSLTKYNGTYVVTQDNAVISNLEIHGNVVIQADNVTMKNVKVVASAYHAVQVATGATGFTLQDSEIDGTGTTSNGIYGQGTFLRNDISGVENGITVDGNSKISGNYIHSLLNTGSPHYDGIEVNSGSNIEITGNTVVVDHTQTSAIMLDNYFGGLSNITVDGNRLVGGGYTVYLDDSFSGGPVDDASIRITNNQVGGGYWGDYALYGNSPVMYGNTGLDEEPTPSSVYDGTSGNDVMPSSGQANGGSETYNGLGGNDVIKGGAGADVINGGAGIDTATYAGSSKGVDVSLKTGKGTGGHAQGDTLTGIENLTGSSHGDTLEGNGGRNVINGGKGVDKMIGGKGNDIYGVNNSKDVVVEYAGGGRDLVKSGADYKLSAHVESLQLTGTLNLMGTGNALSNKIIGNTGSNGLFGGAGNDVINGGKGNDTLVGGSGYDKLTGGGGADKFVFKQASLKADQPDHITDFSSNDLIYFDVSSGPTGALKDSAFHSGTKAHDSSDRFIFDKASDTLYFDKDGAGSAAQLKVAVLDNGYNLTADDIWLF